MLAGLAQATPQVTHDKEVAPIQQKAVNNQNKVVQDRQLRFTGSGGIDFPFYDYGRSPKEYGQWLQATGRQKWTKKKRK